MRHPVFVVIGDRVIMTTDDQLPEVLQSLGEFKLYRGRPMDPPKPRKPPKPMCKEPGCYLGPYYDGLCRKHLKERGIKPPKRTCTLCDRPHLAAGLCDTHYKQAYRTFVKHDPVPCIDPECPRKAEYGLRGYCKKCWRRIRKEEKEAGL